MEHYLEDLKFQVVDGLGLGYALCHSRKAPSVDKVLFVGVGGSAISGDILKSIVLERSSLMFTVHRGGKLPQWVDSKTFLIFSSYSGNTKEVLEILKKGKFQRSKILIVTSGGKLARLAAKEKYSLIRVPESIPPRCALGLLTFSVLPILKKIGRFRVSQKEVQEIIAVLATDVREEAHQIAKVMHRRAIFLYGVSGFMQPAVTRWRAQLAENAKTLASHHVFPEMLHNEIEGWQYPKSLFKKAVCVFFVDSKDHALIHKKRKMAAKHIQKSGADVVMIETLGAGSLARLFSFIHLGDWVSYELAKLNQVDAISIPVIESMKKI